MNSDRHMELYYAISGIGAVCNTINPRLPPDDIAYIVDHAEDGVIFCDPQFLPITAPSRPGWKPCAPWWYWPMPRYPPIFPPAWPVLVMKTCWPGSRPSWNGRSFDENTASGALLHLRHHWPAQGCALFPPFAAACDGDQRRRWAGSAGHRPGSGDRADVSCQCLGPALLCAHGGRGDADARAQLDPASLLSLMNEERATVAVGVPTIWLNLINHLRDTGPEARNR